MMRKTSIIIALVLSLSGCSKIWNGEESVPDIDRKASEEIGGSCSVYQISSEKQTDGIQTRSIIGQTTITSISSNFIKLDEPRKPEWTDPQQYEPAEFTGWNSSQTKILDASVLSSPDNTEGIHFRSIVFKPRQTYQIAAFENEEGKIEDIRTVSYISRMVGWYPKTFEIPTGSDGTPSDVSFIDTDSYRQIESGGKTYDCVVFKNKLDGETDVMMTDMREGRYDQSAKGFRNNSRDYDVQPYGHMFNDYMDPSSGYRYCNYFTYNHYLTAVRVYMRVKASDLSLISWKSLNDVVFPNQPTTVSIALPDTQARSQEASEIVTTEGATKNLPIEGIDPVFGNAMLWEDYNNLNIIKTPMAENDPDYPDFAQTPEYPVKLDHSISHEKTYLGYLLLQPDRDTEIEIHTDAGILKTIIPKTIRKTEADGSTTEVDILKAGYIYNIVVDMKADGGLDVIIGNEDFEKFRDLAPYNKAINDFEFSNCYVISKDKMKKDENTWYEGFYFLAQTPGRGEKGSLPDKGDDLYPDAYSFSPQSARILWQDTPFLVTHVELIHGYVRFTLNEKCRTENLEGNAVLAVYDKTGSLIWSWHIWVTSKIQDIRYPELRFMDIDKEENKTGISNPGAVVMKTIQDVRIMNMNLGATQSSWTSSGDPLDTYGLYYQWGRKDPSPIPPAYNYGQADMTTSPYYYMDEGTRNVIYKHLTLYPTVETAAKRPLDIVAPSKISETYPNDWLYSSIDYLWGYDPTTKAVVKKTIYDPCPYGYRVADEELFALFYAAYNGMSNVSYEEFGNKGIRIYQNVGQYNYFPFSGWRGHDRGRTDKTHAWYEVGFLGDYQDARVCKDSKTYVNHRGRNFIIAKSKFDSNGNYNVLDVGTYKDKIVNDFANRTSASPVRCVRYDNGINEEPSGN